MIPIKWVTKEELRKMYPLAESWMPVIGYEGIYEVSDAGNVMTNKTGRLRTIPPSKFYSRLGLSKYGKVRHFMVHILVWRAFKGDIPKGYEINHKDGNKRNPSLNNLELLTPSENQLYSYKILGRKTMQGSKHGRHKLVEAQVMRIRKLHASGWLLREIAELYQCSLMTVSFIVNRKTWRHI